MRPSALLQGNPTEPDVNPIRLSSVLWFNAVSAVWIGQFDTEV